MKKRLLTTCGAIALLAGVVQPAGAVLQLSADFNGFLFNCVDQTACDTNPTAGVLSVGDQVFNGVSVNGSIQTQTVGGVNILNTSSLSIINNNAGTVPITVAISGTSFTGPNNQFSASSSATFQNDIGGTLSVAFYDDPANNQGADTPTDTPGILVANASKMVTLLADSFAFNAAGAVNDPGLFSMTLLASGDIVAGGEILNRGQTLLKSEAVPEPSSLAILGAALAGLGFIGWLRRRPDATFAV